MHGKPETGAITMSRLALAAILSTLAACSQPPAAINLSSADKPSAPPPVARAGTQGDPAALERCRNANWRATGYRHGLSGYPLAALKDVSRACEAAGIKVDRLAYSTGRLEGLALFCSTESGYRRARAGLPVDNTCPPSLKEAYEAGHARGVKEL